MLIHNSEFVYNDWVGLGNLATVYGDDVGTPGEFSQNTMFNNGESVDVRSTGKVYKNVLMNDIQVTNSWHDDITQIDLINLDPGYVLGPDPERRRLHSRPGPGPDWNHHLPQLAP